MMSRGRDGNGLESGLSPGLYLLDLLCSPLTPVRRGVVAWTLILGVLSSECPLLRGLALGTGWTGKPIQPKRMRSVQHVSEGHEKRPVLSHNIKED